MNRQYITQRRKAEITTPGKHTAFMQAIFSLFSLSICVCRAVNFLITIATSVFTVGSKHKNIPLKRCHGFSCDLGD